MLMMTPPLLRYFWFHSIYSLAASCSLQSAVCSLQMSYTGNAIWDNLVLRLKTLQVIWRWHLKNNERNWLSALIQYTFNNSCSLHSKCFQTSYSTKVGVRAKQMQGKGGGGGGRRGNACPHANQKGAMLSPTNNPIFPVRSACCHSQ